VKKRILQLFGSFHIGGSEKQAVMLTKGLLEDGRFEIMAASLNNEGPLKRELSELGDIPEYRLSSFYDRNFIRKVRECAEQLKRDGIDLIHTHDFYTNVFGIAAGTLAGIPALVASKRETLGMRSRSQEFVEGLAFRRASAVIANSDAVKDLLLDKGLPRAKIHSIYNGVDITGFTASKNGSGFPSVLPREKRIITLVANLRHNVKNVPMFLRTAGRVTEKMPDTHFAIAGEGELADGLKQLASDMGISQNVTFLGRCADVPALLSASFACVLTSSAEGFSNSILEYMASGKPVVATRVGGAAEAVVDGETGFLVEPNDSEQMARLLIDLITDPARAALFGEQGRMRVTKFFSPETQLQKTMDLYTELLTPTA
jgi:glycosyltransferase involved in cell wall biosynthesis